MDEQPYARLKKRRAIRRKDLPDDLVEFYSQHEGCGLDSELSIRLCTLDEIARVKWQDLNVGRHSDPVWNKFAGLRIGMSEFFDEIIYILTAPSCSPGMIVAFGENVAGPGGTGSNTIEPSLVLSATFTEWLSRLESSGWIEHGLTPGDLAAIPKAKRLQLMKHFKRLNPDINWA